jgi:hypothetical protein
MSITRLPIGGFVLAAAPGGDLLAHATRLRAIVSSPAFSRDALPPVEAVAPLAENLTHPGHEFWTERLQLPAAFKGMEPGMQGYRQLTDAYLLALASRRKGVLATFDRATRARSRVTRSTRPSKSSPRGRNPHGRVRIPLTAPRKRKRREVPLEPGLTRN